MICTPPHSASSRGKIDVRAFVSLSISFSSSFNHLASPFVVVRPSLPLVTFPGCARACSSLSSPSRRVERRCHRARINTVHQSCAQTDSSSVLLSVPADSSVETEGESFDGTLEVESASRRSSFRFDDERSEVVVQTRKIPQKAAVVVEATLARRRQERDALFLR